MWYKGCLKKIRFELATGATSASATGATPASATGAAPASDY